MTRREVTENKGTLLLVANQINRRGREIWQPWKLGKKEFERFVLLSGTCFGGELRGQLGKSDRTLTFETEGDGGGIYWGG